MAKDGKSLTDEFDINNGLHATDADGKLKATFHSDDCENVLFLSSIPPPMVNIACFRMQLYNMFLV